MAVLLVLTIAVFVLGMPVGSRTSSCSPLDPGPVSRRAVPVTFSSVGTHPVCSIVAPDARACIELRSSVAAAPPDLWLSPSAFDAGIAALDPCRASQVIEACAGVQVSGRNIRMLQIMAAQPTGTPYLFSSS